MQFSYDIYKRIKQSKMFLANPQKNYIGVLSGVKDVSVAPCFNDLSKINFNVYEEENGVKNKYYDRVEIKRLIEVQYFGWFQIQDVLEKNDGVVCYKEVECLSLENTLVSKKIYDVNGVFALYDITDTENSLLHIIAKETGWKIGHVSNELIGKWRTFAVDSAPVYNFLTQDISKSFDCIFQFDTYDKRISVYKLSEIGDLTDIVISYNNILKEWIRESSADSIVTKLKVTGSDNVDIRAVNPTGTNYLINVDYFKTTEWMTQSLIDALDNYQAKYDTVINSHTTTLSLLKQRQEELTVLRTELIDLESQLKAQEHIRGTFVSQYNGAPPSSVDGYDLYLDAVNKITTLTSSIKNKDKEIENKQLEIETVNNDLDLIGNDLSTSNNFTNEQIYELNEFLTENEEYNDPTFVVTDNMSEDEITDMKLELMENGANELQRTSQPQYVIKTSASNIFTIIDDKQGLSYEKWKEKLAIGNLISIRLRDNYFITVRLMKMEMDFNKPDDFELTLSNASRLDSELIQLGELQSQAGRTSSTLSLRKIGYDEASKQRNEVRDFMNGSFNATLNRVKSDDNVQTELSEFGILNRKWLEDQNKYSDYQSWFTQNVLLFTSDNWKTSQTGIGLFTNDAGEDFFGVLAPVIVGEMVLTSALRIMNMNNSIIMDKDGAIFEDCDITINKGDNVLYLNASDGIKLTKNDIPQFYIDNNGNATFRGYVSVSNGTNTINLNSESGFEILRGADKVVYLDTDGNAVFNGHIYATSGTIAGFDFSDDEITGGLIYDKSDGKFIRLSPNSSMDGQGGYNIDFGAIDLGLSTDNNNTLIHLRSDGYARFGLVAEGGTSVRFNDFLRYEATNGEVGTDTILYSQNFQINRDGTVSIVSPDVIKEVKKITVSTDTEGYISSMRTLLKDNSTRLIDVQYDVQGRLIKVGETDVVW